LLWLVNEAGPRFADQGKADSKSSRDNSRSGVAFRLAQTLQSR
jgi:hypothetical protein